MSADSPNPRLRPFHMQTVTKNDVTTIRCSGRLKTESCENFKQHVKALIPESRRIILDLTELEHMDSSGLGAIVSLYVSCRGAKCPLELVNLSKNVRELLGLTKVLSLFEDCGKYMVKMP